MVNDCLQKMQKEENTGLLFAKKKMQVPVFAN